MRLLYHLLWLLSLPIILLRMLWRSRRLPAYRQHLAMRLGWVPVIPSGAIHCHTVSVGEFLAAFPLIQALLARGEQILLTCTTPTAKALIDQRLGTALASGQLHWCYLPWDHYWFVRRFWRRTQPGLVLLFETELWPGLLARAQAESCPVLLLNARLSASSLNNYQRYGRAFMPLVHGLAGIACQTTADAQRFAQLGVPQSRLSVVGNLKLSWQLTDEQRQKAKAMRAQLTRSHIWLAASTHHPEEAELIRVQQSLLDLQFDCTLILVPRHPERAPSLAADIRQQGLTVALRSENRFSDQDVLLLDTIGELRHVMGAAQLVFIGGSWVAKGGQSPLEACAWCLPIFMGPSYYNFQQIVHQLQAVGALTQVADQQQLVQQLSQFWRQPELQQQAGSAALNYFTQQSGSLEAYCQWLGPFLTKGN